MLCLDDETLPIINNQNTPLPPKGRKTRNKMKRFKV
jgi:hypothetical protein